MKRMLCCAPSHLLACVGMYVCACVCICECACLLCFVLLFYFIADASLNRLLGCNIYLLLLIFYKRRKNNHTHTNITTTVVATATAAINNIATIISFQSNSWKKNSHMKLMKLKENELNNMSVYERILFAEYYMSVFLVCSWKKKSFTWTASAMCTVCTCIARDKYNKNIRL